MVLNKNPLFPAADDDKPSTPTEGQAGYLLPSKGNRVEPLHSPDEIRQERERHANPAAKLIREKLARIYDEYEPDAAKEAAEAEQVAARSPHQQFMHELSTSGKSLAEIQTEWHSYYASLPDDQKHQVWQEFYEANATATTYTPPTEQRQEASKPQREEHDDGMVVGHATEPDTEAPPKKPARQRSRKEQTALRTKVQRKVRDRAGKLSATHKQNLHSLLFGLSTGIIVLAVFMFGFFNEVIIAPFMQPGRATATPIIINNDTVAADGTPQVIIPKINVQIPVIYDLPSNQESVIQDNLEDGVVHYPSTERPGQKGNVAIFGHSSNNIFNKGKYKFAFVLLHELRTDDTFYLTYKGTVYAYKVIDRKIVDPSEVGVLNDVPGQTATATLITCDPPGTSLKRLVVVGEQISPDPAKNTAASPASPTATTPADQLSGNGPSLWTRFWQWLF